MVQKCLQSFFSPAPQQTLSVQGELFTAEYRALVINCHSISAMINCSCVQLFCTETEQDTLQEVSVSLLSVEPIATLLLQVSGNNSGDSDSLNGHEDDAPASESSKNLLQSDATFIACTCPCWPNFNTPHQPTDLEKSKTAHGQQEKLHSRSIQGSWYAKHAWISVNTLSYKVFCHVCAMQGGRAYLPSPITSR